MAKQLQMVDALLFLQDHKADLQSFGSRCSSESVMRFHGVLHCFHAR